MNRWSQHQGLLISALAFIFWGLLPLFYQYLDGINIWELLAQRLLWSVILFELIYLAFAPRPSWQQLRNDPAQLGLMVAAGCMMTVSWSVFSWALTHQQVLAASLGYFMTPLFNIAFGVLFFKERLVLQKLLAVILAVTGLIYMLISYGQLPLISLVMGGFFAVYGLMKKKVRYPNMTSLYVENLCLLPFAVGWMLWMGWNHQYQWFFEGDWSVRGLLILCAPMTLLPVLLFSIGVRKTPMSTVGLLQYIEPSLAFVLAIFWFKETPDAVREVGFAFVWAGLLVSLLPLSRLSRFKLQR
ncbi:EamA family transporter RarD [Dongshaea marina]|uniref:EamA family transporter RarD n=1 Tax=Dongshaea marina TaxID=2047966 RepID=UPI000D3E99DB|nr:EamA family transporter RarD [Dongshaea marina]